MSGHGMRNDWAGPLQGPRMASESNAERLNVKQTGR